MTKLRAVAVGALLLAGALWPAVGAATPACATASGPRAGLVVDDGTHVRTFCIALDASTVTGLHLVELAADQYGLNYTFGLGGLAVCRLNGVGPTGDDCFADYPDYWGYWHGDGHGGWTWAGSGAGGTSIGSGDVDAWSWGSGDSGTTHPKPDADSSDICGTASPTAAPSVAPTTPASDVGHAPSPTTAPRTATPSIATVNTGKAPAQPGDVPSPKVAERTSITAQIQPVSAQLPVDGGPPLTLLAAVGLATLFAVGGWLRLRGRRKGAA